MSTQHCFSFCMRQFPDSFVDVIDASSTSISEPFETEFLYGPGVGRDIPGTVALYGTELVDLSNRRHLLVKEFYVAPPGRSVRIRSPCPIPGSEYLPPDRVFPLTLHILRTTDDQIVYGCNGGIVLSTINFRYIGSGQMETPTRSPVIPTVVSGTR
eukprot:scaffold6270_cov162-Amphora_coffeaeformis.AAC.10